MKRLREKMLRQFAEEGRVPEEVKLSFEFDALNPFK